MTDKTFDFKKYQGTSIKVTKVKDKVFSNDHPHGYNLGHQEIGMLHLANSNLYQCLFLITKMTRYWHSSQVVNIEEHEGYDYVETLNSTYKVEPHIMSITGVQEKHPVKVDNEEENT